MKLSLIYRKRSKNSIIINFCSRYQITDSPIMGNTSFNPSIACSLGMIADQMFSIDALVTSWLEIFQWFLADFMLLLCYDHIWSWEIKYKKWKRKDPNPSNHSSSPYEYCLKTTLKKYLMIVQRFKIWQLMVWRS